MSGAEFVAVSLVVAAGSIVQGSIGFGLGLIGAPLLMLIDPRLVPAPLLCSAAVLTVLLTYREWKGITFGDLRWALSGYILGIVGAAIVLVTLATQSIGLVSGGLILLGVALTAAGLPLDPRPGILVGAGALSGFMGTTVSIGGPPIGLVYQRVAGPRIRGTLSAYFLVGIVLSLIGLGIVGRFGRAEAVLGLALVPGVLLGFALSHRTARWLDRGRTRTGVLVISAAAALVVILKHLP